ncbi:MAG: ComEC/Rec2 family competence protein [Rhodospirillales bacterium]
MRNLFAESFARETGRWPLWLPVFMAMGVAGYFALSDEPPLWLGVAGLLGFAAAAYALRLWWGWLAVLLALAALALGFGAAQWRTVQVAAPVLEKKLDWVTVQGRVLRVERFEKRLRVTLGDLRIQRLDAPQTPARIRVRLIGKQPDLRPGDWISIRASLVPPPAPAAPGAFDFQRQAYFQRLGAVGFALGRARVLDSHALEHIASFHTALAQVRQNLTERILSFDKTEAGAIAAALMTGDRSAIPEETMEAVRDSGLAHLLAISGLHIGLVAGILFVGVRGAFALVPPLTLRFPIKKWAAAVAIPGALMYALISGATVPTLRAFLMISLVLIAVLLDRRGISMRMVAWAAAVILLFQPESLLGASFQMSFAAVIALIAVYEWVAERGKNRAHEPRTPVRTVWFYIGSVALTTLVAGLATAPFAIYHFNRFALYGLAANLIAVPVTALWIMPWAVIAFLLMPFGLEELALTPMRWGIGVMTGAADTVAGWPGAAVVLPAMSTPALIAVALGLMWLCLWRRRWRLWGGAAVATGMATLLFFKPPDILIDGEGKLTAVRLASGQYAVTSLRRSVFTREVWMRRIGHDGAPLAWPKQGSQQERDTVGSLRCDGLGCLYRTANRTAALVTHPGALLEDCARADLIVSTVPIRGPCPGPERTIDRFDLWRDGAHSIRFAPSGIVVETVNGRRGTRPWVLRPKPAYKTKRKKGERS